MRFRSDRARIAIIGAAFRMPGVGSEDFWEALLAGRNLVSTVEASRWAQESLLHPRKGEPGTTYTFAAGSIGDVSGFDAAFFGISPREAEQMDPQQRLLLEMSWEALESAAIPPSSMRGHRCGVYVGLSSIDYAYRRADDLGAIDATTMTGNTGSIAANRISYVFDLRGPSMTVDTACSSSLVALHQACQSIRHGESDTALVGGISLHLHPYAFIGFSKASMLSRQGRCAVFDEQGDGYVRSEGGALVLLKPLTQAIADGNQILAVIAETGVNNDGRKTGLTVPSHLAQATLLREVYERAGITPEQVDYFEAHGTGTAVGDPIEARAIGEALGQRRPRERPLPVGSVKSQVGHLEAASGMAGLIKALHVLRHRRVPPNIHLNKPNPHIDLVDWNLAPVTQPLVLKNSGRLVVGVSAFGFGGTNAHAVLTSFEASAARPHRQPATTRPPLMLSARSPAALQEGARRMANLLRQRGDLSEYDIAYSARFGRDIHPHRLSVETEDRDSLVQALDRFAASGASPEVVTGKHRREASAPAFVFSGNGSQWVGMGLRLLDEEPVFREALEEIDGLFASHCDRSIVAELRAAPTVGGLDRTEIAQPALFALQVSLVRLFESRGIHPVAVCGHSVGEVAAAWASGALTLEAAVRVIYERSIHQAVTRGTGCMAAVELAEADINTLLGSLGLKDHLVVAAINSGRSVTVAGDSNAMTRLGTALTRAGVVFRRLALDYAFHSAAMDPIRTDLVHSLASLNSESSRIPLYSTVAGALIEGSGLDAEYWWRNVREPVRFDAAIREMVTAGINTFLEIGPRPVLTAYLNDIGKAAGTSCFVLGSLTNNECGSQRIRAVCQQLELSGALHDPTRLFPVAGQWVDLPQYAWQRERYWHPTTPDSLGVLARRTVHPLLGYALAGDELHWENHLDIGKLPAYADHAVAGSVVFPAAGFVEMALAAGASRHPGKGLAIEDLEIVSPLLLEAEHSKVVRLRIKPDDSSFTIISRDHGRDDNWRTHAVGRFVDDFVPSPAEPFVQPSEAPDVTAEAHYALASAHGLQYGPAFQSVAGAWFRDGGLIGALRLPDTVAQASQGDLLHPAYLDGAFQLLLDLTWHQHGAESSEGLTFLPVRIDRIEITQPPAHVAAAKVTPAVSRHRSRRALHADFTLYDQAGAAVTVARGVRFRATNLQRGPVEPANWITTRAVAMPRRRHDRASAALPSAVQASLLCAQQLHTPERSAARLRFAQEFEPLLDVLCASFSERALRQLADGETLDPAALLAAGRVCPSSAPLLRNLLEALAEDGVLQPTDEQWRWVGRPGEPHFPEPGEIWRSLIADYPEYSGIIAHTGSAGVRLSERLRFGMQAERHDTGATSWIDSCTQEEAAAVFDAVHGLVKAAVAAQPVTARLRVLYILGGASLEEAERATLPPTLDRDRCDVIIAARSREALDGLRVRHAALSRLPGHVLDLETPAPEAAEALGGRFDLVILSEGLAGSPDPRRPLDNIRQLLFAGGLLVVLEQHATRAEDLVKGPNPGWWRLEGPDQNAPPQSPRRAPHMWALTLRHAGFEDVERVCDTSEGGSGPYLLIAQADAAREGDAVTHIEPTATRTWLVVCDEAGYSADLALTLTARLADQTHQVLTITPGSQYACAGSHQFTLDPTSTDHWRKLLAELRRVGLKPDAWVHLAGLDLATGVASRETRTLVQETRASVLVAWLQACSTDSLRPECWIVGAQTGSALLPPYRSNATITNGEPAADRLRDSVLWGLTRVAMQEFSDWRLRWIDLADPLPCEASGAQLAQELLHPDAEDEIILTGDGRFVPRMRAERTLPRDSDPNEAAVVQRPVQLDFSTPGPFRNLTWRPRDLAEELSLEEDEIEIEVKAAGLNFRDVMYAMGLLPDEAIEDGFCGPNLGMELSGVVSRTGSGVEFAVGDEVIAIAPASFASRARTRTFAVTRKPAHWSFAAAATVPTAFFTAYYALVELGRLRPGERVLIHGAAGGVGIAAIQIAKHLGAEVLATAGTDEKRDFVTLLGADRVFDSRSLSFADEILHATSGAGIDVVLNSLAGESMRRNLRLLRPFGRMIELGKRDFYENSRVGLRPFRNNIAYFGIDADQLIAHRPEVARRILSELMSLFAAGTLHPLPHRSYPATDVEVAFRQMQASRHIGKIVVTFPTGLASTQAKPDVVPPINLSAQATYLVTGGLAGFGLSTARWLVSRGARYLALLGRRGATTPEANNALREFASAGVTVTPIACDVSDSQALQAALDALGSSMPPLRGVVHAAMVIEDFLIRDMNRAQLQRVLAPKVTGALNLHEMTRHLELDFFLLYSSATTLFGNPGQAAYVAANMALEALAEERRQLGLPAACVGWGPIGDSGYLARNERVRDALVGRLGGRALSAAEALSSLDTLLANPSPRLGFLDLDWNVLRRALPSSRAPKFSELVRHDPTGTSAHETTHDLRCRLTDLPEAEQLSAVTDLVRAEIAQILRIAPERIESAASLFDMGMDSLMAVELAASIEGRLGIQLSALALSNAPTIERIAARITQQLRPSDDGANTSTASDATLAGQAHMMAAQHASEITHEEASALSTQMETSATISLTAGQNS